MSMSQEEIEALMSGADDFGEDESSEDIETQDADDILTDNEEPSSAENVDDILAGIDGIVDDEAPVEEIKPELSSAENLENLIEQNQYPLPAKSENKVVNQLNEVAEDSEEKASQIFDVLSFILDENDEIQKYNNQISEFIEKQATLLESLTTKFPNINVFNENLELSKTLLQTTKDLSAKVDGENNKVFGAMELMQYHDINRQKIERVMSVIKKLNNYLNGIFEDDSDKPEVQIAKHISGDSNDIVDGDDLESLISEFAN
jgi:hypothetical protein